MKFDCPVCGEELEAAKGEAVSCPRCQKVIGAPDKDPNAFDYKSPRWFAQYALWGIATLIVSTSHEFHFWEDLFAPGLTAWTISLIALLRFRTENGHERNDRKSHAQLQENMVLTCWEIAFAVCVIALLIHHPGKPTDDDDSYGMKSLPARWHDLASA